MKQLFLLIMLNLSMVAMAVNSVSQTFLRQDLSIDTKELDGSKETFINYTDAESSTVKLIERNPQNKVAARSISEGYKPMLVEGRTWWYTQKHRLFKEEQHRFIAENGISVGEEIEIDGVKWHKIDVVSTGISRSDVWTFNTEPRTIAYMREDGNKIYTAYFDGVEDCEAIRDHIRAFTHDQCNTQISYEYHNIGESFFLGNEDHYDNVIINNISKITNSGFEYNLYECDSDVGFATFFIEGLGCTGRIFGTLPNFRG